MPDDEHKEPAGGGASPAGSSRRSGDSQAPVELAGDETAEPSESHEFIDLDKPPPGLPELTFPGSPAMEDQAAVAARRSRRLRTELVGGGVLVAIGLVTTIVTQNLAALVLSVIVLGALVAYELLVTNLE